MVLWSIRSNFPSIIKGVVGEMKKLKQLSPYALFLGPTMYRVVPFSEGLEEGFTKGNAYREESDLSDWILPFIRSVKSFDEIPKEFTNYRSLAKLGGIGFSIALLGVFLPMYNRHVTNKKEAKRKALLEQQRIQNNIYNPKTVFPKESPVLSRPEEKKDEFLQLKKYSKDKTFSKIASQFIREA